MAVGQPLRVCTCSGVESDLLICVYTDALFFQKELILISDYAV